MLGPEAFLDWFTPFLKNKFKLLRNVPFLKVLKFFLLCNPDSTMFPSLLLGHPLYTKLVTKSKLHFHIETKKYSPHWWVYQSNIGNIFL